MRVRVGASWRGKPHRQDGRLLGGCLAWVRVRWEGGVRVGGGGEGEGGGRPPPRWPALHRALVVVSRGVRSLCTWLG